MNSILGVLPYTVTAEDGLQLLLWRHGKSTRSASSAFFSQLVCERSQDDAGEYDTVARCFATHCGGVFVARSSAGSSAAKGKTEADDVKLLRKQILNGLRRRKGVVVLCDEDAKPMQVCYSLPVRHRSARDVNARASRLHHDEARWVRAVDLLRAMVSDVHAVELTVPLCGGERKQEEEEQQQQEAEAGGDEVERVPLYTPFVQLCRSDVVLKELRELVKKYDKINDDDLDARLTVAETDDDKESQEDDVDDDSTKAKKSAADDQVQCTAAAWAEDPAIKFYYTCRKCRLPLFADIHIREHEYTQGIGTAADDGGDDDEAEDADGGVDSGGDSGHAAVTTRFGKKRGMVRVASQCHSYFVDHVDCAGDLAEVEGKLLCRNCTSRIGYYNWSGAQCSCGHWVVPSIQVVKSKVDERTRRRPPAAASASQQQQVVRRLRVHRPARFNR